MFKKKMPPSYGDSFCAPRGAEARRSGRVLRGAQRRGGKTAPGP